MEDELPSSYRFIENSIVGTDCKEAFCRQLSDQLLFCEKCHARPILFNVQKDEYQMRRHLERHQHENDSHRSLAELLLSTMD